MAMPWECFNFDLVNYMALCLQWHVCSGMFAVATATTLSSSLGRQYGPVLSEQNLQFRLIDIIITKLFTLL
jgi:hypothetical protein